jgi:hypothetical protein
MKLNITPGPWVAEYISYVPPFKCSVLDGNPNDGATYILHGFKNNDIAAIVTAVNNTYHAGINPEAVPDMLDALKMALQTLIVNYPLYKECPEYEFISKAIQKATL